MRSITITLVASAIVFVWIAVAFLLPRNGQELTETTTVTNVALSSLPLVGWTATAADGRVFRVSGDRGYNLYILLQAIDEGTPVSLSYTEAPLWVPTPYPLTITAVRTPSS